MPIDPTSLLNVAGGRALNPQSDAKATLDKDGFLKLLTEQLKNQDPQSQQDPSQYFSTISQMTMVEQLTNLAGYSEEGLKQQQAANAAAMIGHSVTYKQADGAMVTGLLESVQLGPDATTVTIAGVSGITVTSILEVA
jgi:flagellar basal-body rod modification protein FlgD